MQDKADTSQPSSPTCNTELPTSGKPGSDLRESLLLWVESQIQVFEQLPEDIKSRQLTLAEAAKREDESTFFFDQTTYDVFLKASKGPGLGYSIRQTSIIEELYQFTKACMHECNAFIRGRSQEDIKKGIKKILDTLIKIRDKATEEDFEEETSTPHAHVGGLEAGEGGGSLAVLVFRRADRSMAIIPIIESGIDEERRDAGEPDSMSRRDSTPAASCRPSKPPTAPESSAIEARPACSSCIKSQRECTGYPPSPRTENLPLLAPRPAEQSGPQPGSGPVDSGRSTPHSPPSRLEQPPTKKPRLEPASTQRV